MERLMSWSKIAGSILWLVSGVVWAAQDPIGWKKLIDIPATNNARQSYEAIYVLTNQLPFQIQTPLQITLQSSDPSFKLVNSCSDLQLMPNQSCEVRVQFTPSRTGLNNYQLIL